MGRKLVYSKRNASLCDDDVILPKSNTSFTRYRDCIRINDLIPIILNGTNSDNDIQNFCGKTPKRCSETLLADLPACPELIDFTNHFTNTVEKVNDYFCSDGGSTIKTFLKEDGPNCIRDKKNETLICKQDFNQGTIVDTEIFMNCIIQKLKTCNKPKLTKIFETVAGITHDSLFHPVTPMVNKPNAASGITLTSGIVLVKLITLFI